MRIRTIKPEFWTDRRSGEWDAERALFYVGIWQFADDVGRLRLEPRLILAALDPFGAKFGGVKGVTALIETLVAEGRILPYEVSGETFGLVRHFEEHQVINRPSKSRLPEPPEGLTDSSGSPPGALTLGKGKGKGSGKGNREEGSAELLSAPASPVALTIKCSGKGPAFYEVTEAQVAEWSVAYPGVDVLSELRKSAAWQDANPERRKTHRGMAGHLVNWLGRAQNGAKGRPQSPQRGALPVGQFDGTSGVIDFATGLKVETTP